MPTKTTTRKRTGTGAAKSAPKKPVLMLSEMYPGWCISSAMWDALVPDEDEDSPGGKAFHEFQTRLNRLVRKDPDGAHITRGMLKLAAEYVTFG